VLILFSTKRGRSSFGPTEVYCFETNQLSTQSFINVFLWRCIIFKGGSKGITRWFICWIIRKCLRLNEVNDELKFNDGLFYFKGLLYISLGFIQLEIIQMRHNLFAVGHFGFNKTMELISRDFWWPKMWNRVKEFIQSCGTYARRKVPRHWPYVLYLLPIPKGPWLSLSMDFITDLPLANGNDSIFVVVNRLTKMVHFILCNKTVTEEETAKLFLHNIYCIHGLSNDIILCW
jgi:hypothetical protein